MPPINIQKALHSYMTNLESLFACVEYIRQCLENKLEGKAYPSLMPVAIAETSPLAILCRTFNLSAFERDILLLCVGMEIDRSFGELCGKLQGNPQLNYPSLALALAALPNASFSVFSDRSPLQAWQLIEFLPSFSLSQTPIRIDKRILCYLLGEKSFDEQLSSSVFPFPNSLMQVPLSPSQENLVQQLVVRWSGIADKYPIMQLCGVDISAKYRIVFEVCQRLHYNLGVMSVTQLPHSSNEINQLKKRWEREAILSNSILLLDCEDLSVSDPQQNLKVSLFIDSLFTPLIICTFERQKTKYRPLFSFDIPSVSYHEQIGLWQSFIGVENDELNGIMSKITAQFNLSPALIQAACNHLNLNGNQISIDEESYHNDIHNNLWNFCRTQARPRLEDLAQRIETNATWKDLVLPERQEQILKQMLAHLRQRGKVYEDWGFADKERRGLGISALFSGQSGTGKTMAAGVLAKELNLDLYRIDLSVVVSKYIGETEKNLRRIFDAAETGGAILLFDEADALFGKRTEVKDSHDRHANIEVSYLLQRMEAYQGLAILTTNMKNALDSAFMRRIRFVIDFPFPDSTARSEIWRRIFPEKTPTEGLDFSKLGKLNVAGGNIRNIALNAAILAADASEPVMMKHILQATQGEYIKLERTLTDNETRGWV